MSLFLFTVSLFFYISLSIDPLSLWLFLSVPFPTSSAHPLSFLSLQFHFATTLALLFHSRKHCSLLHLSLLALVWTFSFPSSGLSFSFSSLGLSICKKCISLCYSFLQSYFPSSLSHSASSFLFIHTSVPVSSVPLWTLHLVYPASHPFPSVSVPRYPCLCIYTCLFPFILLLHLFASHIITSPFSSSWCLFLPLFPVFLLPCNGIKSPHLSHSQFFFSFLMDFLSFSYHNFFNLPISLSADLSLQRWAEVVMDGSTISMQSHGAVTLPSLTEPAAKYRHCWGSASLPSWKEGRMSGWTHIQTHTSVH